VTVEAGGWQKEARWEEISGQGGFGAGASNPAGTSANDAGACLILL